MAVQDIGSGLPFPTFVNETATVQEIGESIMVNETAAASTFQAAWAVPSNQIPSGGGAT